MNEEFHTNDTTLLYVPVIKNYTSTIYKDTFYLFY